MMFFHWLLQLLFPARCVLCRKILEKEEKDLCPSCRREALPYTDTKRNIHFLDSFVAVWYYEGKVRGSLLRFKFRGARGYAQAYGRLLAQKVRQTYPEGFDVLTWVPVSPRRKRSRGYDQVELLAGAVGRELDMVPIRTLRKTRHNRRQSGISDPSQRRANVLGVYQTEDPQRICGKRILLLDDILTTGATASECGRMLLTAGAKEVYCAAVAAARKQ